MPYNGELTFGDYGQYGLRSQTDNSIENKPPKIKSDEIEEREKVLQYVDSFNPYVVDGEVSNNGLNIAILKKDGTWDNVYSFPYFVKEMPLKMSDWVFHYDDDTYARSLDGYLRARITKRDLAHPKDYSSTFFVIDYTPQKVTLSHSFPDNENDVQLKTKSISESESEINATAIPVRIFLGDINGLTRVVLERLRSGTRIPSRIEVTNFKQGYYDTTIDRETTFTAVGYNDNGSSRSLPLLIEMPDANPSNISELYFTQHNNYITIDSNGSERSIEYILYPLTNASYQNQKYRKYVDNIDITPLQSGVYAISAIDVESGEIYTYKFTK